MASKGTLRKGNVFQNADAGRTDKKFEGYSNLQGAHDQT